MAEDGFSLSRAFVGELRKMLQWWRQQTSSAAGTSGRGHHGQVVPYLFRRFELRYELTPGGTAEAYRLCWDSDDEQYEINEDVTFTVFDPSGLRWGHQRDRYASPNNAGARGWAVKPHDRDIWEIVEFDGDHMRRFELNTAITPAGSATAYLLDENGDEVTAVEFTVYDSVLGDIRAPIEAKGFCRYMPDSEHWEIVTCQRQATRCVGTVKGAVTSGNFTVDNVVAYNGLSPVASSSTEVTVWNIFDDDADDGAVITFQWNPVESRWDCENVACTTS